MSKIINCIKQNRLLFCVGAVSLIFGITLSIYITLTIENPVYYNRYFANTTDYPWMSFHLETPIEKAANSLTVHWAEENHIFLQLFDNTVSLPPSDSFDGREQIPEGARRLQFDFGLNTILDLNIWASILQFDESGIIQDAGVIENIQTRIARFSRLGTNTDRRFARIYSLEAPIYPTAHSYKILLRILPTEQQRNSFVRVFDMDVIFR